MTLITFVTRVHFADRVLEDALAEEMARLGMDRPLVLVDAEAGDEADRLPDALPRQPRAPVRFAVERARAGRCGPARGDGALRRDGSATASSAAAARARSTSRGFSAGRARPVVAVPTGTESVGLGPLAVDFARHGSRQAFTPSAILCDATLTAARRSRRDGSGGDGCARPLPRSLSQQRLQPAGRRHRARRAAARGAEPRTRGRHPGDLAARRELLAAALNGGLASQKGFGGIEAAARGLEAEAGARHGALHAALLPRGAGVQPPRHRGPLRGAARGPWPRRGGRHRGGAHAAGSGVGLPSRLSRSGHPGARSFPAPRTARRPTRRTGRTRATPRTATTR